MTAPFRDPGGGRRPDRTGERVRIDGARKSAHEAGKERLLILAALFAAAFALIAGRLTYLGLFEVAGEPRLAASSAPKFVERAEIVDRNGVVLATNLKTMSLYAEPRVILDAAEAADKLAATLPDLDRDELLRKLTSNRSFIWLKRKLTPRQEWLVNSLGIPGLGFLSETKRLYPQGRLVAHALGYVDTDNRGIAGVEGHFDRFLSGQSKAGAPLTLALDVRVQHALRDEIERAVGAFEALGGAGLVLDATNGEVLALVSLPDFDPNNPGGGPNDARFNRVTKGVYEMGSTFKTFTTAMALESGVATMRDGYDASEPIHVARFVIHDDHPQNRWLTVPEIFVYSSNIGSAKMALDVGAERQRNFLASFGMLERPVIDLPEAGAPAYPARWGEIATMTIAYGHGVAVTPVQLASGIAAMVNGGTLYPAKMQRLGDGNLPKGKRVISAETSGNMRALLGLVVDEGTGRQAAAAGYRVGGKTGTAEKVSAAGYQRKALLSSFVGAFPIENPRYVVFAMIDEPKGNKSTYGFATGGWTAAPVVGRVVTRIAPMLGIAPIREIEKPKDERLAAYRMEAVE